MTVKNLTIRSSRPLKSSAELKRYAEVIFWDSLKGGISYGFINF
jgi:hypothetical protein